jgi:hypothetical protein
MISNLPPQEMKPYIRSGAIIFGEAIKQAHGGPSLSPLKSNNSHGMGGPLDLRAQDCYRIARSLLQNRYTRDVRHL